MNDPPEPPVAHWWTAPSHDGLLDTDILLVVRSANREQLEQELLDHQRYYLSMGYYVRQCLVCRDSARRMGQPSGNKQEWWEFVWDIDEYLCVIESRMMCVVEEMKRQRQQRRQQRRQRREQETSWRRNQWSKRL